MKFAPTYTTTYKVACCDVEASFTEEYEAQAWLVAHIKKAHPARYRKLEHKARRAAMSQNGDGYYDSGTGTGGGWHKMAASFRDAWRKAVVLSFCRRAGR